MIDTTKLKINSTQKLPPMPDPYQQQPMAQTQQVQQAPPQPAGQDWQNFDWMKDFYGGRWYDFGANEGQPGWWRAPRINPSGAEAVWNEDYGWQDWDQVAGGDYSGLTPQFGDVYDIFGAQQTGGGQAGTQSHNPFDWLKNLFPNMEDANEYMQGFNQNVFNPNYSDLPVYPESDLTPGQGFQYPEQWDWSSDVLRNFAYGDATPVPWQWDETSQFGQNMMETGMPVDITGYGEKQLPYLQDLFKRQADQAIESAGLAGLRHSSPLGQQLGDLSRQMVTQYGADIAGKQLSADEAARQRQMQAGGLMQGLGSGVAGLGEAARNRALQAGGMLPGLGQQYLQAPQDWAQRMWGMGTQQQGIMQQALDRAYQDFMRMAPEYSPWLQQAFGYSGLPPMMAQQQYGQSGLGGLFGGLLQMLPFMFM
jgi:hypothetical protein